jgi:hypothetical protein
MRSKNLLLATSLAALAALVGCSPDAVSPSAANSLIGTLAFSYSGGIAGTFSASGVASNPIAAAGPWATGLRDSANVTIDVVASLPRSVTTRDIVIMSIPRLTTGSSTVDVNCVGTACASFIVDFGSANTGEGTFVQLCVLTTGTLALTTVSSSRATGTFSGTGDCFSPTIVTTAFTVTGGTFDVAILPGSTAMMMSGDSINAIAAAMWPPKVIEWVSRYRTAAMKVTSLTEP